MIVVIGAGLIGLGIAYELAESGADVRVIDAREPGGAVAHPSRQPVHTWPLRQLDPIEGRRDVAGGADQVDIEPGRRRQPHGQVAGDSRDVDDDGSRRPKVEHHLAAHGLCLPGRRPARVSAPGRSRAPASPPAGAGGRSTRPLSLIPIPEPTRLLSISYAVFCLQKKRVLGGGNCDAYIGAVRQWRKQ